MVAFGRLFLLLNLWEQPEQPWAGSQRLSHHPSGAGRAVMGLAERCRVGRKREGPEAEFCVCVCVLGGCILTLSVDPSFVYSFSYSLTSIYGALPIFQALCEETDCGKCDG